MQNGTNRQAVGSGTWDEAKEAAAWLGEQLGERAPRFATRGDVLPEPRASRTGLPNLVVGGPGLGETDHDEDTDQADQGR